MRVAFGVLLQVIDTSDNNRVIWTKRLSFEWSAEFDVAKPPKVTNGPNSDWNNEIAGGQ